MSVTLNEAPAKRAVSEPVAWRIFLRGLAVELDAQAGSAACAAILRGVGQQMARLMALVAVASLEALELEMNVALAEIRWGSVRLKLQEAERCITLVHSGLPRVGSAGEPPGTWLAPVLEGLYQGWMTQQPGADSSFLASIRSCEDDRVAIRYGR